MSKKLYVGNLSYSTTDESLSQLFAEFGTVKSASVIMDQMSGRSKGFGFVEMENDESAMSAIEKLNGKDVDGRSIKVNEARPKTNDGGSRGFGGGGRGGNRDRGGRQNNW